MSWQWSKGIAKLHTIETLPGELFMTSGPCPDQVSIPRIEPTSSFRSLGVYLTPSGNSEGGLLTLRDIALNYATIITGNKLS
jgi:hypothetical protein